MNATVSSIKKGRVGRSLEKAKRSVFPYEAQLIIDMRVSHQENKLIISIKAGTNWFKIVKRLFLIIFSFSSPIIPETGYFIKKQPDG